MGKVGKGFIKTFAGSNYLTGLSKECKNYRTKMILIIFLGEERMKILFLVWAKVKSPGI
jgi:hypothetical protein